MRYIGVDLHTAQITVCYLTDQGHRVESWKLSEMPAFCEQLTIEDEMAVEATGTPLCSKRMSGLSQVTASPWSIRWYWA